MNKIYFFFFALLTPVMLWSQVVSFEDFEGETPGAYIFTSNGQFFNISSNLPSPIFAINYFPDPYGYNGTSFDNYFIDNDYSTYNVNVNFNISTAGGVPFKLKSMWLYVANSDLRAGAGDVIIVGLRNGDTVFTATEHLNSSTDASTNFFSKFDLSTYGGADNSEAIIDGFNIRTTGDFEYLSLDALTWESVDIATPIDLAEFNGTIEAGVAHLNWQTGDESSLDHMEVERSLDNGGFEKIASIPPKGSNSPYSFNVLQQVNKATYRVKLLDKVGKAEYSRLLTLSKGADKSISIFPNPAHDYININSAHKTALHIYDAAGRLVKKANLLPGVNQIDISGLMIGTYYCKVDETQLSFIKN